MSLEERKKKSLNKQGKFYKVIFSKKNSENFQGFDNPNSCWQGFYCVFMRQYFQISSKISNFSKEKKILRIFQGFYWNFSNFQIFTQFLRETFDFVKSICEIKLTYIQIERKKITKIYRSFDGRGEKKKKIWKILENFKQSWRIQKKVTNQVGLRLLG